MSTKTVTYLTLLGKPGSHPLAEGENVEHEGERFIVDSVSTLWFDGKEIGWQANAVPACRAT